MKNLLLVLNSCISSSLVLNSFSISRHFFFVSFLISLSKMANCSLKSAGSVIEMNCVSVGKTFNRLLNSRVILFCSSLDLKKNWEGLTSRIFIYFLSLVMIIPSLISFIGICCWVLCFLTIFAFLLLFFPIN